MTETREALMPFARKADEFNDDEPDDAIGYDGAGELFTVGDFRRARSALAALPSCEGWRPVSEAPKDGARILLCWKAIPGLSEHVELGKWKSPNGDFVGGWCNTYGKAFNGTPDYYMPLPSPPERKEK